MKNLFLLSILFISVNCFSQTNWDSIATIADANTYRSLELSKEDSVDIAQMKILVKEMQILTLEGLKLIRKERLYRLQFREAHRLKMEIENYEKIINK